MTDNQKANRSNRLSVEPKVVDGVRVVTMQDEIDHDVKDVLSAALMPEDSTVPPRIVVDLSGVTFMDSSGINVFVAAYQQVSEAQGWLRIAGAQDSVLRVLQLVGVDTVIPPHHRAGPERLTALPGLVPGLSSR
ncbi:STAS domain-containing protein [Streptomyces sp. NPDC003480]